ncbi:uncharacterized protein LOC134723876 [Mytilus trossulus]|uniref:uncharacterized protein LOC134723876 n=1 Tax=Mytilus trossulus TaxID=6551 RepID=UPI003006CAB8
MLQDSPLLIGDILKQVSVMSLLSRDIVHVQTMCHYQQSYQLVPDVGTKVHFITKETTGKMVVTTTVPVMMNKVEIFHVMLFVLCMTICLGYVVLLYQTVNVVVMLNVFNTLYLLNLAIPVLTRDNIMDRMTHGLMIVNTNVNVFKQI